MTERLHQQLRIINKNVTHMMRNPTTGGRFRVRRRLQDAVPGAIAIPARCDDRARLVDRPKSLHILWNEYMFGSGNNKPAKDFTPEERGMRCNVHKYCLRNNFWKRVAVMVNAGWACNVAIERIYDVYNRSTVTKILEAMRTDKKNKTVHMALCVLPVR